jgi:LmbE family N-acetylglucosaminyl deacetylase
MNKEKVLVVCAHPDDEAFGVGGTIAKYVQEGKNVAVVVFSSGEKSHLWLKEKFSARMRKKEHAKAKKILGYKHAFYLEIEEGKFNNEKTQIKQKLTKIIRKYQPRTIFTHNIHDPHPDHQEVNRIATSVCHDIDYKGEIYMFDVWNVLNLKRFHYPMLYVDISTTFPKKIEALGCFKSQYLAMSVLLWNVYSAAITHGWAHKTRFAERFFKLK